MQKKNLIIAFGGISPEHEVSVLTAIQAASALSDTSWNLVPLYISKNGLWLTGDALLNLEAYKDLPALIAASQPCSIQSNNDGTSVLYSSSGKWFSSSTSIAIDAVLLAFHGADGENGSFQGLFESYNIPYTGSGVSASSMGMDKWLSKERCRQHDIPVVEDLHLTESQWIKNRQAWLDQATDLGFPLFVKPVSLGSSIGVKKVEDTTRLTDAVEESFRYDSRLLIEKAVDPLIEINCSVLGDVDSARASVCEQPVGKEELLSFEDKYMSGGDGSKGMASAGRIIPAPISDEMSKKIQDYATRVFQLLGCSGVARLDFLLNAETNEIFFNEINTIPGSFSFYLWEASGISFDQLLETMISLSLKQYKIKNSRVRSYEVNLLSKKAATGLKGLKSSK
ncbi:D-alanine--D-alanine ligase family protein [Balneolaceae bacterium ANBcel3]|nr:D-alanine--D-alanine ligase family protein [Balneolaceae bacterium ANBcel3]